MERKFIILKLTESELKSVISALYDTFNHYEQHSDGELAKELEKLLGDDNAESSNKG